MYALQNNIFVKKTKMLFKTAEENCFEYFKLLTVNTLLFVTVRFFD